MRLQIAMLALAGLVVNAVGCDGLPGHISHEFALKLTGERPNVHQRIAPLKVRFTLGLCAHFGLFVEGWRTRSLPIPFLAEEAPNTFQTRIPIRELVELAEGAPPLFELRALCEDGRQTYASLGLRWEERAALSVSIPTASAGWIVPLRSVQEALLVSRYSVARATLDRIGDPVLLGFSGPPIASSHAQSVALSAGCPTMDCKAVQVGSMSVPASVIYQLLRDTRSEGLEFVSARSVPGEVRDLRHREDGSLVVVSDYAQQSYVTVFGAEDASTTTTATTAGTTTTNTAAVTTALAGRLASNMIEVEEDKLGYLVRTPSSLVLTGIDGESLAHWDIVLSPLERLVLGPDRLHYAALDASGVWWLGTLLDGHEPRPLQSAESVLISPIDWVAWRANDLWLIPFDRPETENRYDEATRNMEPGTPDPEIVRVEVDPRAQRLIVSTSFGLRVIDRSSGALLGGLEHLEPEALALAYGSSPSTAALIGKWALLASSSVLYGVDLDSLPSAPE